MFSKINQNFNKKQMKNFKVKNIDFICLTSDNI